MSVPVRRILSGVAGLCWITSAAILVTGLAHSEMAESHECGRVFFLLLTVAAVLTTGVWLDRRITPVQVAYQLGRQQGYREGVRAHRRGADKVTPLYRATTK